jgi:hypothetical protein
MKNNLALLLMCSLMTACMQSYPENPSGGDNKACNFITYTSSIEVQVRGGIPNKLFASVNGMPLVNECTLGTDNDNYRTVREDGGVKVLIRVGNNAAMTAMFFNEDGSPKSNVRLQFNLSGNSSCGGAVSSVYSTSAALDWEPVYSNSNKSCGPSGYFAKITN